MTSCNDEVVTDSWPRDTSHEGHTINIWRVPFNDTNYSFITADKLQSLDFSQTVLKMCWDGKRGRASDLQMNLKESPTTHVWSSCLGTLAES